MRRWTMTQEHAEHAKANPPRDGYSCGPHAETYGGGCFNCGWQGKPRRERRARATASREEQHGRYLDCGPAAWDDR